MKNTILFFALSCAAALPGFADVIYSTLGPGDSFDSGTRYRVYSGQTIGASFVPNADYQLSQIRMVVGPDAKEYTASLYTDSATGLPDALVEAQTFSGVGILPVAFSSVLSAHQRYWLVLTSVDPITTGGWHRNDIGVTGDLVYALSATKPSAIDLNRTLPAYSVEGTRVPEPTEWTLLAAGILTVAASRKVQRRR